MNTAMKTIKVIGEAIGGLCLLVYAISWFLYHWTLGIPFGRPLSLPKRDRPPRRRYVTQGVRAAGQNLITALAVGFGVFPHATFWVTTTVLLSFAVLVAGFRLRTWLDNRHVVKFGDPIRDTPRPARRPRVLTGEVLPPTRKALPPSNRTTAQLIDELSAGVRS